jgi:hypothetical protein
LRRIIYVYMYIHIHIHIHIYKREGGHLEEDHILARILPLEHLVHGHQLRLGGRRGGEREREGGRRVTVSESLYPSHCVRVTVSESLCPSHCIRVTISESLYSSIVDESKCIRVMCC